MGLARAQTPSAPLALQHLQSAHIQEPSGPRWVHLPHQLAADGFAPEGSLVTLKLQVDLAQAPTQPVGVYVAKMALSGRVWINGHVYRGCERGALEEIRCLHRPYLFETPPVYWKAGRNELQFDIYATARQSNGLSSVWVGDVALLERAFYRWRYGLQVELVEVLSGVSLMLGCLALGTGWVLRRQTMYYWFGWTSVANGFASSSILATHVVGDVYWFSWFVFGSRLISGCLGMMMFADFFNKLTPTIRRAGLLYTVMCLVVIGLGGNNRAWVSVLYVPILVAGATLMVCMWRWSWQRQQARYWTASTLVALIFAAGIHDWLKLKGDAAFEGVYLVSFAYSGVLFLWGGLLLGLLGQSLVQSQALSAELEDRVEARTREIQETHTQLMATQQAHAQALERERLLKDVHDGFGSQLVTAHMLVRHQALSQKAIEQLLQECIADLHLVISTLGNPTHSLQDVLADMGHRTQQRLMGTPFQLHWDVQLDNLPALTQDQVLNLMRIVQEALNNVFKHAGAHTITVLVQFTQATGVLLLRVIDDGRGLVAPTEPALGVGVGLATMHKRAKQLGARLTVSDQQPGTCVELRAQLL